MAYRPQRLRPKKRIGRKILIGATVVGLTAGSILGGRAIYKKHQATVKARIEFKKQISENPLTLTKRWPEFNTSYVMSLDSIAVKTKLPLPTVIRNLARYGGREDLYKWKNLLQHTKDPVMRERARKIVLLLETVNENQSTVLRWTLEFIRDPKNRGILKEMDKISKLKGK
ncbi:MAG: hypothetical protein AB1467_00130 [Candidatus Diapherotrites archaeon]